MLVLTDMPVQPTQLPRARTFLMSEDPFFPIADMAHEIEQRWRTQSQIFFRDALEGNDAWRGLESRIAGLSLPQISSMECLSHEKGLFQDLIHVLKAAQGDSRNTSETRVILQTIQHRVQVNFYQCLSLEVNQVVEGVWQYLNKTPTFLGLDDCKKKQQEVLSSVRAIPIDINKENILDKLRRTESMIQSWLQPTGFGAVMSFGLTVQDLAHCSVDDVIALKLQARKYQRYLRSVKAPVDMDFAQLLEVLGLS